MPRRRLGLIGFLLLCSLGSLAAAWDVRGWGDALSRVDPYSEANAIREARNFLDHGLWQNAGLGTVFYPGLYPTEGYAGDPEHRFGVTPEGVYTHYPPGPEYLLYGAMRVLGPSPVWHLRLLPIAITWLATLYFGLRVRRRFGPAIGWMVMAACMALPSFSDSAPSLHYEAYGFALLLVEIALCLDRRTRLIPLVVIGFLQGWLSFDYAFLVALTPAAVEAALPRLGEAHPARWGLAVRRCLLAGGGFTLAHMLHFVEVWTLFGSFGAALADLAGAAEHRAGMLAGSGLWARLQAMVLVVGYYLVNPVPLRIFFWHPYAESPTSWQAFRFLGMTLAGWWVLVTALIPIRDVWARRVGAATCPGLLRDWLVVSIAGLIPSTSWLLVMLNHASIHTHYLFRHLFLAFFLMLLFVATTLVRRRPLGVAAGTPALASNP